MRISSTSRFLINHVTGGHTLWGKASLYKNFGRAKAIFCFVNLQANDSFGGKAMQSFSLGVLPPVPPTGTCMFLILLHICHCNCKCVFMFLPDDIEDKDDNKVSIVKKFPTNPVVCDLQSTPWANASVTYVEITDIVKIARIRSHLKKKDLELLILHLRPQKALSAYCYLVTFSYLS